MYMERNEDQALYAVSLTDGEKMEYLRNIRMQLIKLLTLIEEERDGGASAMPFFGNLIFDIGSADWLYENRLSSVIVKLYGLYRERAYLTLDHKTIRNKIFESRGIVDGLSREIGGARRNAAREKAGR